MNEFQITPGLISGVKVWNNTVFEDTRGRLSKAYVANSDDYGCLEFNTIEHFFTTSHLNVFRGMHLQSGNHPSSKIVTLVSGKASDYLIDLRPQSKTFGKVQIIDMGEDEPKSIFIPIGVAHGYHSQSEKTIFSYRYDSPFCSSCDSGISPRVISHILDLPIEKMILSPRDLDLDGSPFEAFHSRAH
jgi:dTDP-4-dehydrorhamnose 3,5-epimerase